MKIKIKKSKIFLLFKKGKFGTMPIGTDKILSHYSMLGITVILNLKASHGRTFFIHFSFFFRLYFGNIFWIEPLLVYAIFISFNFFTFLLDESLGQSKLGIEPGFRVVCWGPFGVERTAITREGFPFVLLAIQMLLRLSLSHRSTVWIFQVKTNWR